MLRLGNAKLHSKATPQRYARLLFMVILLSLEAMIMMERCGVWKKKVGLHVLKGHESKIYSVAFDGKRIVTGSMDKTVRVWDPASGYVYHPRPLFGIILLNRAALVRLSYRATQVW
jgi:WD40 repeat protein